MNEEVKEEIQQPQEAIDARNLIDASGVEKESQEQIEANINKTAEEQQNWYLTEGIPGDGDKPEWLLPKYKSVADQAKAYTEAQKRLGGFTGAPKDGYDMSFLDEYKVIDKESTVFNKLVDEARKMNMSQDSLQGILQLYVDDIQARTPDINSEMEKLGPGGKEQLSVLRQWAENNLDTDLYSSFVSKIQTADDVRLMAKLRELTKEQPIPTAKNQGAAQKKTIVQLQQQIQDNYQRYQSDSEYRKQIQDQMQELL